MKDMVVQFNENHKWCGCLGIITKAESEKNDYLIGVPIPQGGTAYIFAQIEDFEPIGKAIFVVE